MKRIKVKLKGKGTYLVPFRVELPTFVIDCQRDADGQPILTSDGFQLAKVRNVILRGIYITSTQRHGIVTSNATIIENPMIVEGCYITQTDYFGIAMDTCQGVRIIGNHLVATEKDSINIGNSGQAIVIGNFIEGEGKAHDGISGDALSESVIVGNVVRDLNTGIYMGTTSADNIISSNYVENCAISGITTLSKCTILGNRISDVPAIEGVYGMIMGGANSVAIGNIISGYNGINISAPNAKHRIIGNDLTGCTNTQIVGQLPTCIIQFNAGFVTENSGSETGTGAQQTIPHGCGFTPTDANVILTNIDDGANPYLSAAPDATNIYVTAVSGKKYRWEVKRNP